MANLGAIDRTSVPESEFELIPDGEYVAQIIASEMCDTKAGDGQYLKLRIQILEPPYQGRLVFDNLNLINPNEKAVAIAKRSLNDICKALGYESSNDVEDSEELHGKELMVRIVTKEGNAGYAPQNAVKKYMAA